MRADSVIESGGIAGAPPSPDLPKYTSGARRARLTSTSGKAALLVLIVVLFILPLIMLVAVTFWSTPPGHAGGSFSLAGVRSALSDPATGKALVSSLIVACAVSISATAGAVYFAWIVTRTNTPLRRLVTPLMVVIMMVPSVFYALAWDILGYEDVGLMNQLTRFVTQSDWAPFNVESWPGLLVVIGLKEPAFAFLLLYGAFAAMDRTLEDASRTSGAGPLRTFFGVTIPVLAPAIIGIVILEFTNGLEQFNIPLILGLPAGIHVFSTEIYGAVNNMLPPDYGRAGALALGVTIAVIILVQIRSRILRGKSYVTILGKGHVTEPQDIGRWRYLTAATIIIYAVVAFGLPLFQLIIGSFQPAFGIYSGWTLNNYTALLQDSDAVRALTNTAITAVGGGFIAMLLAVVISFVSQRSGPTYRTVLDLSTWIPWTMPGVVLGLGMLWAYISLPGLKSLYATVWIVFIGLIVAGTPLASRVAEAALLQVSREHEEASAVSGANIVRTFARVMLPIIKPSFIGGWIVTGVFIAGNLAVPIMLSSPSNITVPVKAFRLYGVGQTSQVSAIFCLQFGGIAVVVMAYWLARIIGRKLRSAAAEGAVAKRPHADTMTPTQLRSIDEL